MISTTPHGGLQILHAAYAAAYRQVAINHQLEAYRHTGHDLRASAHLELIQLGGMRQGAGAATSEEPRGNQGWPFSTVPINLYQGMIALL